MDAGLVARTALCGLAAIALTGAAAFAQDAAKPPPSKPGIDAPAPPETGKPAPDVVADVVSGDEPPDVEAPPEPVTEAVVAPTAIDEAGLVESIEVALAELEAGFGEDEAAAFNALLEGDGAGEAAAIGQLLHMRRHFDRAAWFFGRAALGDGENAAALNNFAAMLAETYQANPEARPAEWIATATDAVRRAAELAPDDGAIQNNLGRALLELAAIDEAAGDAGAAVAALERARELAGDEVLILANLARALAAAGEDAAAADALARAHEISPLHPSVFVASDALQRSPGAAAAYGERLGAACNVNFRCVELCPRSIIGQITLVSCEIAQSSAQMACQAGEPYAPGFNCAEEIPEYGILIPGLNAGFSIATPFGSFHAVVDGAGNVQWRVEAGPNLGPINPYVRADGGYSPSGGVTVTDTRAGVKVNLVNRSPVGRELGNYGFQPIYVQVETDPDGGGSQLEAGVYGNASIMR